MEFLTWIVVGGIAGLLATRLIPGGFPGGAVGTVVGGALGAVLGGLIFSLAVGRAVIGVEVASLLVALAGAVLMLAVLRIAWRRGAEDALAD